MACTKVDCPRCAAKVAARRSKRCYERFGAPELGILVVTFPAEWRRYLSHDVLKEAEGLIRQSVMQWAQAHLGGSIGGRAWWHPTGDKCDHCGEGGKEGGLLGKCANCGKKAAYKPHLNIAIPGAVLRPDGTVEARHMFLGKRQMRGLRDALAEVLEPMGEILQLPLPRRERLPPDVELAALKELAELRARPGSRDTRPRILELEELTTGQDGPVVNFFWEYRADKEKKRHALRYFGRPFPAWELPHNGRDFGLLAGQGPNQKAYRAAVRADVEDDVIKCPCCGADAWARMTPGDDGRRLRLYLPSWAAATGEAADALER